MNDWIADELAFITGALPSWMTRRSLTLASGAAVDLVSPEWANALVVVAHGAIELETAGGESLRLCRGAVLSFRGLRLRSVRNPAPTPAVLVAVWKSDETAA